MRRPRIVLADDHVVMQQGLRALLQPRYDVVACVSTADTLVAAVQEHEPDVVVSDISMPGDGLDAFRRIRERWPSTRVVFLTMNDSAALAASALRQGASGYVLKTEAAEQLAIAIDAALAGRTHLSPELAEDTLAHLTDRSHAAQALTERQLDVLRLLGHGCTMKEIADRLCISPRTVAFHKYRIMEVMGVKTTAELLRKAMDGGLVEP